MKGLFDERIWPVKTYCWGKEGHTDIIKFLVDAQAAQRKKGPSLTSGKDEAQQSLMREKKRILDMKDDEGVNLSCNFSDLSFCICWFFPMCFLLFGCSDAWNLSWCLWCLWLLLVLLLLLVLVLLLLLLQFRCFSTRAAYASVCRENNIIFFFCCYADVAAIAMDFVLVNVFMLFCVPILFLLPPPDLSLFCPLYHWRWWITFLMHLYLCAVRIDYPEGVHAKLGFKAQTWPWVAMFASSNAKLERHFLKTWLNLYIAEFDRHLPGDCAC